MQNLVGICMDFDCQCKGEEVLGGVAAEGTRGCGVASPDTRPPSSLGLDHCRYLPSVAKDARLRSI